METVIELKGVVAVLGSFPALAGVSLSVQRGEILLLQGPNGAGKTSLLRVCAGLMPIERGTGSILGIDLATNRQDIRTRVGLLGHTNGLYLDLTVEQNIQFWASTVGASQEEVANAMSTMRVDGRLAKVKAGQLSVQRFGCSMNLTRGSTLQVAMNLMRCCAMQLQQARLWCWQVMKVNVLQVWQRAR
jgi:ABC-type multidrug transport system ATPase subunit